MNKTAFVLHILVLTLLVWTPHYALAQNDFGLDFELATERKIYSGMKLNLAGGVRTQDNSSRIDRYSLGAGISYKIYSNTSKTFSAKVFGDFEYLWVQNLESIEDKFYDEDDKLPPDYKVGDYKGYNQTGRYWNDRQRISGGMSISWEPNKRWSFQLKETFQYSHYNSVSDIDITKVRRKYNDDDEPYWREEHEVDSREAKNRTVLRNKLTTSYDIPNSHFEPYVSFDYGVGLNFSTSKCKVTLGSKYKFSKDKSMTVFYRYCHENDHDNDDVNGHLIGLAMDISW